MGCLCQNPPLGAQETLLKRRKKEYESQAWRTSSQKGPLNQQDWHTHEVTATWGRMHRVCIGPLGIYYGLHFSAFMGFPSVRTSGSLHPYLFLVPFFWALFLLFVVVVFFCSDVLDFVFILFFLRSLIAF